MTGVYKNPDSSFLRITCGSQLVLSGILTWGHLFISSQDTGSWRYCRQESNSWGQNECSWPEIGIFTFMISFYVLWHVDQTEIKATQNLEVWISDFSCCLWLFTTKREISPKILFILFSFLYPIFLLLKGSKDWVYIGHSWFFYVLQTEKNHHSHPNVY